MITKTNKVVAQEKKLLEVLESYPLLSFLPKPKSLTETSVKKVLHISTGLIVVTSI